MKTIKQLVLVFMNQYGEAEKFTIRINDPKENLDEATVTAQMNQIIQANVFSLKGQDLVAPLSAYIREVVITEYI